MRAELERFTTTESSRTPENRVKPESNPGIPERFDSPSSVEEEEKAEDGRQVKEARGETYTLIINGKFVIFLAKNPYLIWTAINKLRAKKV